MKQKEGLISTGLADLCAPVFVYAFELRKLAESAAKDDALVRAQEAVRALKSSTMFNTGGAMAGSGGIEVGGIEVGGGGGIDVGGGIAVGGAVDVGGPIDVGGGGGGVAAGAPPVDPGVSVAEGASPQRDPTQAAEEMRGQIDQMFRQLDSSIKTSDATMILRKRDASGLRRESASGAKRPELTQNHIHLTKYALAALIDELILSSQMPLRHTWAERPLQLEYFDDFNAGEVFYQKLDDLRHTDSPATLQVLEIYYLCLALGFKGKFADRQGLEKRKVLADNLARELAAAREDERTALADHGEAPDEAPKSKRRIPLFLVPFIMAGVWFGLYFILLAVLQDHVGSIARDIAADIAK